MVLGLWLGWGLLSAGVAFKLRNDLADDDATAWEAARCRTYAETVRSFERTVSSYDEAGERTVRETWCYDFFSYNFTAAEERHAVERFDGVTRKRCGDCACASTSAPAGPAAIGAVGCLAKVTAARGNGTACADADCYRLFPEGDAGDGADRRDWLPFVVAGAALCFGAGVDPFWLTVETDDRVVLRRRSRACGARPAPNHEPGDAVPPAIAAQLPKGKLWDALLADWARRDAALYDAAERRRALAYSAPLAALATAAVHAYAAAALVPLAVAAAACYDRRAAAAERRATTALVDDWAPKFEGRGLRLRWKRRAVRRRAHGWLEIAPVGVADDAAGCVVYPPGSGVAVV
ncbi:hypothetical protein JL720_1809 [Aureococcus anophagefferens]|nr:hypothetical protein JL720_1809 [Aureococcus anophagefferens]